MLYLVKQNIAYTHLPTVYCFFFLLCVCIVHVWAQSSDTWWSKHWNRWWMISRAAASSANRLELKHFEDFLSGQCIIISFQGVHFSSFSNLDVLFVSFTGKTGFFDRFYYSLVMLETMRALHLSKNPPFPGENCENQWTSQKWTWVVLQQHWLACLFMPWQIYCIFLKTNKMPAAMQCQSVYIFSF